MTKSEFERLYAECLAEAIRRYPDEYGYPVTEVPTVAAKMIRALAAGTANIRHSRGFQLLAKRLGVPYTVRSITAAWHATVEGEPLA